MFFTPEGRLLYKTMNGEYFSDREEGDTCQIQFNVHHNGKQKVGMNIVALVMQAVRNRTARGSLLI